MRRTLILALLLLAAGCTREEETDWIIGRWSVVSCTYENTRTGERGECPAGFVTWEFTERGTVIVDDARSVPYWHKNGRLNVDGTIYEEVAYGRSRMQLEQRSVAGVTTYTFRK